MTRYFTRVSDPLVPEVRDPTKMPTGLRLVREVKPLPGSRTLVEFEDDGAPPEMEGREVTPFLAARYDEAGNVAEVWISERCIEPAATQ